MNAPSSPPRALAAALLQAVLLAAPLLAAPLLAAPLVAAPLLVGPQGTSRAPVVINEVQYDDTGIDDREFVELYNRTTEPQDVSGWKLDSESASGPGPSYRLPANTVLPPRGYWVLGAASVPNVDQVLGPGDLWPDGGDALTLRDAQGKVVDTMVYAANRAGTPPWNPILIEGRGLWGDFLSEDGTATSWQRLQDGFDTDDNGADFRIMPVTPGAANDLPDLLPYVAFFDGATTSQPAPSWAGSFVPPLIVDPTQPSGGNPSAIPASPQGGKALVCWNPLAGPGGSGTAAMLLTQAATDLIFEAWVWFDATPAAAAGEVQSWSLGFRGTTCSHYNFPDPSGKLGSEANGNTGVALTYQVTDAGATLWLVDHGSGGKTGNALGTILGKVVVRRGIDDGWQRLRVMLIGERVDAWFGGSFACGDGVHLGGELGHVQPGGVYVGFRHTYTKLAHVRPFTADFVILRPASPLVTHFGAGVPTRSGTPQLTVTGLPLIGWQGFGVRISGLVPNGTASMLLSLRAQTPPIDLQPFGGQPGTQLLVPPTVILPASGDARGEAALSMPIACSNSFIGGEVHWQCIELDPRLPFSLPLGHSRGLTTTISN